MISRRLSLPHFLVFLSLTILSCNRNKKETVTPAPAFKDYITAYTSGIISNADPVMIELSVEKHVDPGQSIDPGIFEFDPPVKGNAYWHDTYTIAFEPDKPWPNGQSYRAKFHLSRLADVPDSLAVFPFSFRIKNQALDVEVNGLETYEPDDLTVNILKGKLSTSDYAENDAVEKCLRVIQNGSI